MFAIADVALKAVSQDGQYGVMAAAEAQENAQLNVTRSDERIQVNLRGMVERKSRTSLQVQVHNR